MQKLAAGASSEAVIDYDVIIIGAGLTGLHQLYSLLKLGLSVRVFDAAGGVGGTWYWNRYPGCRFDSESYSYAYGFSQELLQEWEWTEHFAAQYETERYLNFVADKFNLRPHIQLNSRIASAIFDEKQNRWEIETEGGVRAKAQFLIRTFPDSTISMVAPSTPRAGRTSRSVSPANALA
jgi:cation diffusion facilitator CzcD-associated flavoprotein CzcO